MVKLRRRHLAFLSLSVPPSRKHDRMFDFYGLIMSRGNSRQRIFASSVSQACIEAKALRPGQRILTYPSLILRYANRYRQLFETLLFLGNATRKLNVKSGFSLFSL
ncbi:hypothetical protein AVEN_228259-1 [Araneus ventricosus]|uniref:Uncharacterized protein n=1 Tax=Araneus ventricosus TaxID=182803 RepID=A0A4Y2X6C1_ARAVE|nr:hypothetical protein AVEN_228259-1 [Araneus ventricosus]